MTSGMEGAMMDANGGHPDEGTIHAWLDGELDAETSAWVESHVAGCADCSATVAEARGLIAGASRVVGLLDDEPRPLLKPAHTPTLGDSNGSLWRLMRVTPARASIAAILLVGLGITLTRSRAAVDSVAPGSKVAASAGAAAAPTTAPAPPMQDSLLRSAIARRIATDQPRRTVEAAPGTGVAVPANPMPSSVASVDASAPARVAEAREALRARADTGVMAPADRARVGVAGGVAANVLAATAAAQAAESTGARAAFAPTGRRVAAKAAESIGGSCLRLESANGAPVKWADVELPAIFAFDSSTPVVRVLTATGQVTYASGSLVRGDADSLVVRMRRIGYEGILAMGAEGEQRTGVLRSRQSQLRLEEVVTTGAATTADAPPQADARQAKASAPTARAGAAKAAEVPARSAEQRTTPLESVTPAAVIAKRVACPAH